MAKNNLSVEEVLAACRKMDGGGSAAPAEQPAAGTDEQTETLATESAAASPPAPPAKKPSQNMSVAEMLAAARGEKDATASIAPKKAPTKQAAKAAVAKKASPAGKAVAQTGPRDTSSILAAARKSAQRGPMSKAEAAKKGVDVAKPKRIAPPMPAKPAYAKPAPPKPMGEDRRGFLQVLFGSFMAVGFTCLVLFTGLWGLGLARFMFPNILTEPPSMFKVGFPGDFPPDAVVTKFKAQFGVWIVNTEYEGQRMITALKTVCTHLGCTPNWLEGEQKFKCPCHGSGFYKDGVNFEGPAPRPLERYAIRVADDGQLEVDKSKKYQQEMGQWKDSTSFVPV